MVTKEPYLTFSDSGFDTLIKYWEHITQLTHYSGAPEYGYRANADNMYISNSVSFCKDIII